MNTPVSPLSLLRSVVARTPGLRLLVASAAFGLLSVPCARAQAAADDLVANSNLETPNATGDWPAGWGKPKVGKVSWEAEGGDHFIRMQATEPGKMMMIYNQAGLRGAKAVEVSIRARVSDLKKGTSSWFDARVMMGFRDSASQEIKAKVGAIAFGKNTDGWVEKKMSVAVPEGAVFIAIMPTLFNVETGTFDFSEISVKAIDPSTLPAAK